MFRMFICLLAVLTAVPATAMVRIKDIATLQGVRDNQLVGYGLVIGLKGSGDTLRNSPFTEQSLQSMLDSLGVNVRDTRLQDEKCRCCGRDGRDAVLSSARDRPSISASRR
jgi:flagellar P-ring protein precursor FlgI